MLLAQRHQAGHFLLGEPDLLASELGKREIFHFVRLAARGFCRGEGMLSRCSDSHQCSPWPA
jgi:hypothetical protein